MISIHAEGLETYARLNYLRDKAMGLLDGLSWEEVQDYGLYITTSMSCGTKGFYVGNWDEDQNDPRSAADGFRNGVFTDEVDMEKAVINYLRKIKRVITVPINNTTTEVILHNGYEPIYKGVTQEGDLSYWGGMDNYDFVPIHIGDIGEPITKKFLKEETLIIRKSGKIA